MVLTLLLCWWFCGGGDAVVGAPKLYQSKVTYMAWFSQKLEKYRLTSHFSTNRTVSRDIDAAVRVGASPARRRVRRAPSRLSPPPLGRRQAARLQTVAPHLRLARAASADRVPSAHPEGRVPPARAGDIHLQVIFPLSSIPEERLTISVLGLTCGCATCAARHSNRTSTSTCTWKINTRIGCIS